MPMHWDSWAQPDLWNGLQWRTPTTTQKAHRHLSKSTSGIKWSPPQSSSITNMYGVKKIVSKNKCLNAHINEGSNMNQITDKYTIKSMLLRWNGECATASAAAECRSKSLWKDWVGRLVDSGIDLPTRNGNARMFINRRYNNVINSDVYHIKETVSTECTYQLGW